MVYLWLSSVWTGFALREFELPPAQADPLPPEADQVHFDALRAGIVRRVMGKAIQVEIRAQFSIGTRQKILVEHGGDAGGIVIGGVQPGRVLHQVHADQQPAAFSPARMRRNKACAASGRKLPMVLPGKKPARRGLSARAGMSRER